MSWKTEILSLITIIILLKQTRFYVIEDDAQEDNVFNPWAKRLVRVKTLLYGNTIGFILLGIFSNLYGYYFGWFIANIILILNICQVCGRNKRASRVAFDIFYFSILLVLMLRIIYGARAEILYSLASFAYIAAYAGYLDLTKAEIARKARDF